MMMMSSRERGVQAKEEGGNKDGKLCKAGSSSSRQWGGGLRNPRIVRVSRTFGGKDRHSKVCTIRGLRDRRIRLSVPTAIQLYDLQDRLGLTQPSKVIDWLLDATQLDIDNLPPLQIPQGFGHQFQQNSSAPVFDPSTSFTTYSLLSNNNKQCEDQKQQGINLSSTSTDHGSVMGGGYNNIMSNAAAHNPFPMGNHSSYYHLEPPSNLSLSQFGFINNPLNASTSAAAAHHFLPSALSTQLFFCPSSSSAAVTPPLFPPYMVEGHDPRHIQLSQQRIKSSYFNPSQDESQPQPEDENEP